jgi:hypothetical protein
MIRLTYILFLFAFVSCADVPNFTDIPKIEFTGVRENVILQSADKDTFFVDIYLEDANGDLGGENVEDPPSVYMFDQRDGAQAYTFQLPKIPVEGTGNGIAADISLKAINTKGGQCCLYPDSTPPCEPSETYPVDTVYFDTYIVDNAGNESNHIVVGPVYIRCD